MPSRYPQLVQLLEQKSLQRGRFVLASGRVSTYYIDGKMTCMDPEGSTLIAQAILEEIKDLPVDAVGGMDMGATPIVGAVGLLQFDVMLHRLEHEYGALCRIEKISARYPRWVIGPMAEIERISRDRGRMMLYDAKGNPLILFEDAWGLRWALEREKDVAFHDVAP